MSVPLGELLKLAKLEPGTTTHRVNGWDVEVCVRPVAAEPESLLNESDIMLDAWVELPAPEPTGHIVITKLGTAPLPDIPDIPDDDWSE